MIQSNTKGSGRVLSLTKFEKTRTSDQLEFRKANNYVDRNQISDSSDENRVKPIGNRMKH